MMASDDKKTKIDPVQKNEAPAKNQKTETPAKEKTETPAKDKSASGAEPSKPEGGDAVADKPSSYSRGEGQKPVTKAYKDNWNAIFAKKKKR
jgi:hypothetical protein